MKVDYDELDKIRERLLTDPSYNDIEITDTPLEEFLQEIEKISRRILVTSVVS